MVQFFQGRADPRDAAYGQLASSLGLGIGNAINIYQTNKALDSVLNDPKLKDAPQSERISALQTAMQGKGQYAMQVLQNRMQVEQQAQQENEQKILGRLSSGEKLTAEDFSSLTPKTQMGVMQHFGKAETAKNKLNEEKLASDAFAKGYKALKSGDFDALEDVISDPSTPLSVKNQLASFQYRDVQREDVNARDVNRRVNSVQTAYQRAISSERNRLGKYGGYRPEEVSGINKKIADLESARNKDMQKLLKNPKSYGSLSIWGNPEMVDFLPGEDNESGPEGGEGPEAEEREGSTMQFNPSNPEHKEFAQKLYKQYGNKEDVRRELKKKFKGL